MFGCSSRTPIAVGVVEAAVVVEEAVAVALVVDLHAVDGLAGLAARADWVLLVPVVVVLRRHPLDLRRSRHLRAQSPQKAVLMQSPLVTSQGTQFLLQVQASCSRRRRLATTQ